jgi:hypothetical protein
VDDWVDDWVEPDWVEDWVEPDWVDDWVEPELVFPLEPPVWVEPELVFPLLLFPLLLFPLLLFPLELPELLFPLELLAGLELLEEELEVEVEVVCGYEASVAIPQLLSLFLDIQI